jgi:hypothetical protein
MYKTRPRFSAAWTTAICLAGLGALYSVSASADVGQLAARLAKLRGEVEQLAKELSTKSTESSDTIRSLARQRSDLELDVRREETRVQKLSVVIAKRRTEIQEEKAKGDKVVPLFTESLQKVREQVQVGMPFRKTERLAALDKIEEQDKSGLLTASRGLSRLWSFVEDEVRLTRESGLYKQTVHVDGEDRLVEVVRIGMVMMFYKTEVDEVGKAVQADDGSWGYVAINDKAEQRAVLDIFTSFKKQVRIGFFELPNALPPVSEVSAK